MSRKLSEINSGIIGSLKPGSGASNSTGLQHGETGSVARARALMAAPPHKNDERLLATLKSRLTGRHHITIGTVFRDGQFYGTQITAASIDADAYREADDILREFEAPAPPEAIAKAFAVMRVSTASREKDDHDRKLQAEVYCQAMMGYPADIALAAMRQKWKWFPTLVEITDVADEMMLEDE